MAQIKWTGTCIACFYSYLELESTDASCVSPLCTARCLDTLVTVILAAERFQPDYRELKSLLKEAVGMAAAMICLPFSHLFCTWFSFFPAYCSAAFSLAFCFFFHLALGTNNHSFINSWVNYTTIILVKERGVQRDGFISVKP